MVQNVDNCAVSVSLWRSAVIYHVQVTSHKPSLVNAFRVLNCKAPRLCDSLIPGLHNWKRPYQNRPMQVTGVHNALYKSLPVHFI